MPEVYEAQSKTNNSRLEISIDLRLSALESEYDGLVIHIKLGQLIKHACGESSVNVRYTS